MKKILLVFTMIFSVAVFSQKEANGKLYIEHPAIEIVNQFNEAYTSGDLDKLKELVTENFQVRTLQDRKSNDINWILGTSNYLSKNITDFQIKVLKHQLWIKCHMQLYDDNTIMLRSERVFWR